MHVFTSRDENSVCPDQLESCSVWKKKKEKSSLSMKVVNIHQLLYIIPDFKRLRNASHIFACTHHKPKSMVMAEMSTFGIFCGQNVHVRNVWAEMSVVEISELGSAIFVPRPIILTNLV